MKLCYLDNIHYIRHGKDIKPIEQWEREYERSNICEWYGFSAGEACGIDHEHPMRFDEEESGLVAVEREFEADGTEIWVRI